MSTRGQGEKTSSLLRALGCLGLAADSFTVERAVIRELWRNVEMGPLDVDEKVDEPLAIGGARVSVVDGRAGLDCRYMYIYLVSVPMGRKVIC